ncbi:MAG: hypothetical protein ACRDKS_08980 [Actinomycetota bacterium]
MSEPAYACSLTDEKLTDRLEQWKELHDAALVRAESLPDGRVLVFRGGEETARLLRSLIEAERRCCPFIDFSVQRTADQVLLTLRFPTGPEDLMSGPSFLDKRSLW